MGAACDGIASRVAKAEDALQRAIDTLGAAQATRDAAAAALAKKEFEAVAERDAAFKKELEAAAERDMAFKKELEAAAERDTAAAERDAAAAALAKKESEAAAERDAASKKEFEAVAERDAAAAALAKKEAEAAAARHAELQTLLKELLEMFEKTLDENLNDALKSTYKLLSENVAPRTTRAAAATVADATTIKAMLARLGSTPELHSLVRVIDSALNDELKIVPMVAKPLAKLLTAGKDLQVLPLPTPRPMPLFAPLPLPPPPPTPARPLPCSPPTRPTTLQPLLPPARPRPRR